MNYMTFKLSKEILLIHLYVSESKWAEVLTTKLTFLSCYEFLLASILYDLIYFLIS